MKKDPASPGNAGFPIRSIMYAAVILSITVSGCVFFWFYTVEDAYISFRYAENFAAGEGLVYNPGERVEGYTNFLWVILLGFGSMLSELPGAAKQLGFVFALGSLALLLTWKEQDIHRRPVGPMAAFLLSVSPGFHLWSVAGLETSLFVFLLVAAVRIDLGSRKPVRFVSGVLFGLATLTRPEGLLFFLLYMIPQMTDLRSSPRRILSYFAGFGLVVIPHQLFRLAYYGSWVPNTFWVKGRRFQGGGWAYFTRYAAMTGCIGFIIAVSGLWTSNRKRYLSALLLPATGYLAYVYHIGGDWMPMGRFLVPFQPFLALSAAIVLADYHRAARRIGIPVVLILSALIAMTSVNFDLLRFKPSHYLDVLAWEYPHYRDWKEVGLWFHENADPGDVMSTGLGGIIPYYSRLVNIDRGGLNDKEIAHIIYHARSKVLEQRLIDRIILERNPDYILAEPASFFILRDIPESFEPDPSWTIVNNPLFRQRYVERTVVIDGRYFTFYQRIRAKEF
ncbi:hypothetical protein JXA40_01655 [bacterium]|nr:hypothetical protein [candidate division CSSED10-310 bacterium]